MTVVDPRWVQPVAGRARRRWPPAHRLVVTVEDGGRAGGVGTALTQALQDRDSTSRCARWACRSAFLEQGSRGQVLADVGLTEQDVARRIAEWAAVIAERSEAPQGVPVAEG